jgi:hypothetical protein
VCCAAGSRSFYQDFASLQSQLTNNTEPRDLLHFGMRPGRTKKLIAAADQGCSANFVKIFEGMGLRLRRNRKQVLPGLRQC